MPVLWLRNKYGYRRYEVEYSHEKRTPNNSNRKSKNWHRIQRYKKEINGFTYSLPKLSYEQKIDRLRQFTTYWMFNRAPYWERRKNSYEPRGICRICNVRSANVRHHIIMLKNGGADLGWNRINVCYQCHQNIHPFMKTKIEGCKIDAEFRDLVQNLI